MQTWVWMGGCAGFLMLWLVEVSTWPSSVSLLSVQCICMPTNNGSAALTFCWLRHCSPCFSFEFQGRDELNFSYFLFMNVSFIFPNRPTPPFSPIPCKKNNCTGNVHRMKIFCQSFWRNRPHLWLVWRMGLMTLTQNMIMTPKQNLFHYTSCYFHPVLYF